MLIPFSALRRWGTLVLLSAALFLTFGAAFGPIQADQSGAKFWAPAGQSSSTYYVDNHASTDGDGSMNSPWDNIEGHVCDLVAGDTMYVRGDSPGSRLYSVAEIQMKDYEGCANGAAGSPITLAAYPGENITLRNSDSSTHLIYLKNVDYWIVDGFTIDNNGYSQYAVAVREGKHNTIRNNEIKNGHSYGILVGDGPTEYTTIENNVIHDFNDPEKDMHCICVEPRSHHTTISNNTTYNCSGDSIQLYASDFASTSDYSRDVLIEGNTFLRGTLTRTEDGVDVKQADGLTIRGNELSGFVGGEDSQHSWYTGRAIMLQRGSHDIAIYDNVIRDAGIPLDIISDGGKTIRNVSIWNNVIFDFHSYQAIILENIEEIYIYNNTIANALDGGRSIRVGGSYGLSGGAIRNNLIYDTHSAEVSGSAGMTDVVIDHNGWFSTGASTEFTDSTDVTGSDPGFVNDAGDDYRLQVSSPAVDAGVYVGYSYAGAAPDLGAYEYGEESPPPTVTPVPPTATPEPTSTPEIPSDPQHVTDGLQVLYTFEETSGNSVRDVSGVDAPLDLTIEDTWAVDWRGGVLAVISPVMISSVGPATKIADACRETNEITLEAWLCPANTTQDGPARVITLSSDPSNRNFTLGQGASSDGPSDVYDSRVRTTEQSDNGLPSLSSPSGSLTAQLTHVVYTRDASGVARIYIDGVEEVHGTVSGNFSNWDEAFRLALGNELTGNRPWLGEFHRVAVFNRALSQSEVIQNFNAGPGKLRLQPAVWLPLIVKS